MSLIWRCAKDESKVPGDFAKKTLLVTTGSEAVENAVKIARAAAGRSGAIAFTGAYHGRTHYTPSLTGKVNRLLRRYGLNAGPCLSRPLPVRAARRQ